MSGDDDNDQQISPVTQEDSNGTHTPVTGGSKPLLSKSTNDEEDSLINCPLYIDVPEPSERSSFPVYEEINDNRNTPPSSEEDNESERSDSLIIETTRSRRPPVRFGIDEYVVKPK